MPIMSPGASPFGAGQLRLISVTRCPAAAVQDAAACAAWTSATVMAKATAARFVTAKDDMKFSRSGRSLSYRQSGLAMAKI